MFGVDKLSPPNTEHKRQALADRLVERIDPLLVAHGIDDAEFVWEHVAGYLIRLYVISDDMSHHMSHHITGKLLDYIDVCDRFYLVALSGYTKDEWSDLLAWESLHDRS